jgi:MFS family permease
LALFVERRKFKRTPAKAAMPTLRHAIPALRCSVKRIRWNFTTRQPLKPRTDLLVADLSTSSIQTDIPFRLDRLPWSRFHLLVVLGLGITWILDGIEVTIVGALGPALQSADTLKLSAADLGSIASCYVAGAVAGALTFGWITDRFGRRLVFYITLIIYLLGVILSALAWDFWSFAFFRMLTGLGIGGEYAAVNSAIDELIPAKYRGRVDLIVNGSFWLGAAFGALAAPLLLNQRLFAVNLGWRLGFGIGGVLGSAILLLRRFVPESPRWLVTHCQSDAAEKLVQDIEHEVAASTNCLIPMNGLPSTRASRSVCRSSSRRCWENTGGAVCWH